MGRCGVFADRYAEHLEQFCFDAIPMTAHAWCNTPARRAACGFGVPAADPLVEHVGQVMASLFSSDGPTATRSGS